MIRPLREPNDFDLQLNQTAQVFKRNSAERLNLPTLNAIVDRVHDVNLRDRVRSPSLELQQPHRSLEIPSYIRDFGPGFYGMGRLLKGISHVIVDTARYHRYVDSRDRDNFQFFRSKSRRSTFLPDTSDIQSDTPSYDSVVSPDIQTRGRPKSKGDFGFGR